jgi:thiamine pyrophosphate-dependent acetolactate synthase large subunit-like protein
MNPERPQNTENVSMQWGSDAIAEMLRRLDLNFIAMNPGASFSGLHDSFVNYLGNRDPQVLLTLHEESAVAIAHGYAKITGKPMGVVVHSNVGLMNAAMTIFNAWCDRVPIIILGGTGPLDAAKRRPWIDWIHTAQDQGALVRDYTKWDDQPASVKAALESLLRAYQLSRTAPHGPVYICLDAELQKRKLDNNLSIPNPDRFVPAQPQEAPREVIRQAAEILSGARHPLILAGRVSRSQAHWDLRIELAEAIEAKVITDMKVAAAFPTGHPLHAAGPSMILSAKAADLIRQADAILSLDWLDLGGTLKQVWETADFGAKVIHCSVDAYIHRGWSKDHQGLPPVDVPITAQPDVILPHLLAAITDARGRKRKLKVGEDQADPEAASTAQTRKSPDIKSGTVNFFDIARALKAALGDRKTCLTRLPLEWPEAACDFRDPLDYIGIDGGGAVGAGPGMAVGAALALRGSDRLPIAILGDGDYLMGVTALWTVVHYEIPLLIIIANNRVYGNCVRHQERTANTRSRPIENKHIGLRIDNPVVDLAGMARAQGVEGEGPIDDYDSLVGALTRAVEAIDKGHCYLIDVLMVSNEEQAE